MKALIPLRSALDRASSSEVPEYVRKDEVEKAIELACRPEVKVLLRFLWVTGCRISEALGVLVSDVQFRERFVSLATLKKRSGVPRRSVPLPDAFLGDIAVLINTKGMQSGDRLFPWSRVRAFELIRDALLAAGVERPRAHPHALRHGHAVHALHNGAPLNIVQRTLGHSSIMTTSIYLRVTGEDIRRFYSGIAW